jgi:hypothetical protein
MLIAYRRATIPIQRDFGRTLIDWYLDAYGQHEVNGCEEREQGIYRNQKPRNETR